MSDDGAGDGHLPSPTREQVLEAMRGLGGGPVQVGEILFAVCAVMGVDTAGCNGSYGLRRRLSWPGFNVRLRNLVADGLLVARTRRQWHDLSAGIAFPEVGNPGVRAYALAETASALDAGPGGRAGPGWAQALRYGRERVLKEHDDLVQRYANDYLLGGGVPRRQP